MRKRDKKAFPTYTGKILKWRNPHYKSHETFTLKIAMVDYNIGYTLVDINDPTDNFTCVNGPLSPHGISSKNIEEYDKKFQYLLDCVRNNKIYDVEELYKIIDHQEKPGWHIMNFCAFS